MSRILLGGLRKPTQLFRLRQCSEYVGPFLVQTDQGAIYQPGMNIISFYNLYKLRHISYVSHRIIFLFKNSRENRTGSHQTKTAAA